VFACPANVVVPTCLASVTSELGWLGVRVEFVAGKSIQGFRWSKVAAVDQKRAPHLPLETAVAERGFRRPQPQITAPGRYF